MSKARAQQVLLQTLIGACLFWGVSLVVGVVGAPVLMRCLAWNASPDLYGEAVVLARILFSFIGFMTVAAVSMAALHAHGRFFITSVSSMALNVGYILGALILAPLGVAFLSQETLGAHPELIGLTLGVLFGGALQAGVQVWGLRHEIRSAWREVSLRMWPLSEDVRKILSLCAPMMVASSAAQVNVWVNTHFAVSLGSGAVSWLSYAFRLVQLPVGIFGVAVGSAALPALTRKIRLSGVSSRDVSQELAGAVDLILWLILPCMVFLMTHSVEVVRVIYERWHFLTSDSIPTAQALLAYSGSLVGYGLIKVLSSFYYAADDTGFALKVSLWGVLLNLLANLFFTPWLGVFGLAMTSSLVLGANACGLLWGLRRLGVRPWSEEKSLWLHFAPILLSTGVAFGVAILSRYWLWQWLETWETTASLSSLIKSLMVLGAGGGLILSVFSLGGVQNWKRVWKGRQRRESEQSLKR